jgi:hypothetical protein
MYHAEFLARDFPFFYSGLPFRTGGWIGNDRPLQMCEGTLGARADRLLNIRQEKRKLRLKGSEEYQRGPYALLAEIWMVNGIPK